MSTTRTTTAALLGTIALLGACGEDESTESSRPPAQTVSQTATELPDKEPGAITCADLADKVRSARMSRRASNALAAEAGIQGLTQLQAAQSIFFAMTELCAAGEPSFRPARPAVKAVKAGRFRADLGSP